MFEQTFERNRNHAMANGNNGRASPNLQNVWAVAQEHLQIDGGVILDGQRRHPFSWSLCFITYLNKALAGRLLNPEFSPYLVIDSILIAIHQSTTDTHASSQGMLDLVVPNDVGIPPRPNPWSVTHMFKDRTRVLFYLIVYTNHFMTRKTC